MLLRFFPLLIAFIALTVQGIRSQNILEIPRLPEEYRSGLHLSQKEAPR